MNQKNREMHPYLRVVIIDLDTNRANLIGIFAQNLKTIRQKKKDIEIDS